MKDYHNGFIMSLGFVQQGRLSPCPKELVLNKSYRKTNHMDILLLSHTDNISLFFKS